MSERFYLPERFDRPELTLSGTEAHHLAHVLRIGVGAPVTLFDGEGTEAVAEVVAVGKREVRLQLRSTSRPPEPTATPITLAVAPPKGDRFRWLVEKATELGVARLVPLITRRSVVDPREGKLDKLRQTIIAACKQSGRCRLMELTDPLRFDALLSNAAEQSARLLLLHPQGEAPGTMPVAGSDRLTLLIGPEGGFAGDEVDAAAAHGAQLISLGPTILRTEPAAIAAAAVATQWLAAGRP